MSNHDREGSRPSSRDDDLARAWREASDEQPPSHLDAALIAAARKAVADRGEQPNAAPVRVQPRNWLLRWQPLAAAATVAGLAFVLVQMLPREHDFAPSMQHKESAPVPAEVTPQANSSLETAATDNSPLPSVDKAVAQPERRITIDRVPVQSTVPEPPMAPGSLATAAGATVSETAPATDTAAAGEAGAARREAMESEIAGRTATAAAAVPSSPAREKNLSDAVPLDAAAWSAKVVALHASGDVTAAAAALRAFRAANPDADSYLPGSLRDWARTVE